MDTKKLIKKVKSDIIRFGYNSGGSSHYGGSLSMIDFLTLLYNEFLKQPKNLNETFDRDYFILSKGHAALGLYSVLYNCGYFDEKYFQTYLKNGTDLIAHPIKDLTVGIESSNGSLGQGISMSVGIAHALLKKNINDKKVYCIVGDGECNEGIVYEALNYASHYNLNNLCVFLDLNGFQNDGASCDILGIGKKYLGIFESIGWNTYFVNGHSISQLKKCLNKFLKTNDRPTVIVGKTIKGNGFIEMENNNEWHHNKISKTFYEKLEDKL